MNGEKVFHANLVSKWVQPAPRMEARWPPAFRPTDTGEMYAQILAVWVSDSTPGYGEDDKRDDPGHMEDMGTIAALITDATGQLAVVDLNWCSLSHPITVPMALVRRELSAGVPPAAAA